MKTRWSPLVFSLSAAFALSVSGCTDSGAPSAPDTSKLPPGNAAPTDNKIVKVPGKKAQSVNNAKGVD